MKTLTTSIQNRALSNHLLLYESVPLPFVRVSPTELFGIVHFWSIFCLCHYFKNVDSSLLLERIRSSLSPSYCTTTVVLVFYLST
jgi:hypothetical protein